MTENTCHHRGITPPARPVPDWTARCPECGELVKHDGRGGYVTVREVNERIAAEQRAVDAFREEYRRAHA